MKQIEDRMTSMETQLREISNKFEKFLTANEHKTLQSWRVASLNKLERVAGELDMVIEFIETELITRKDELIAEGGENLVILSNFFEDQSNSDLETVSERLKDIRKRVFDA